MNKLLFTCLLSVISIVGLFAQTVHKGYTDGQLYVRLKSFVHPKTGEAIVPGKRYSENNLPFDLSDSEKYKIKSVKRAFGMNTSPELNATLLIEFENAQLVHQMIEEIEKSRFVSLVEKVPYIEKFLTPNDTRFNEQWHLQKINAQAAFNYYSVGSNIIIAIVDDALDRTHPDLAPNLWQNPGEIAGNLIDDDGNGYVDDINGWDVVNNSANINPPDESYDHGTHVAGIASGATNNGRGIASIGFSCKLMGIKASSNTNSNSIPGGYNGILYAANMGAHIINMSWGGATSSQTSQSVIEFALSKGCILVSSAGNGNTTAESYPAAYSGVISVANTNTSDTKAGSSHYGTWVKISAPGTAILSTLPFGRYGNLSGTSMASPMVAGLLGLMKSFNPGMPNQQLINCLYSSADNINAANPDFIGLLGAGRINAEKAMACVAASLNLAPIADFIASATTIPAGNAINFRDLSAFSPTAWSWSFPGATTTSSNIRNPANIVYPNQGVYPVSLTVSNANGSNTITKTNYITVTAPLNCTRVNLPVPANWTVLTYSFTNDNGFLNGVNRFEDRQKAMFFDVSNTNNTHLTNFLVAFSRANSIFPTRLLTFRVFDGSAGPAGAPGAELFSTTRTVAQIRANVLANNYTNINIPNNVALPTSRKFFLSVDFSGLSWGEILKDSVSLASNTIGESGASNDLWEMTADGNWTRYDTEYGLSGLSFLMHPYLTGTPTSMKINPVNPAICTGGRVEFRNTGSVAPPGTEFNFLLQGTTPNTVVGTTHNAFYNTAGNFKAFLAAIGACNEVRIDSTIVAVTASPNIAISATKNPICVGETTSLTATGATNYTWSPSTGLNTTTGATVQANPGSTVAYSIQGTTGNCTAVTIFEVEVRATDARVQLQASQINITQPTTVTFTATPGNGGSSPTYNFIVNGSSVQNTTNSTLVRLVNVNDRVVCDMRSTEACVVEKTVRSNEIIMGEQGLPIILSRFSGRKQTNTNQLEWTTGSEVNSELFLLERGNNAINFTEITRIQAAGNSSRSINYNYSDSKFEVGKNYYRLKLQDLDGTYSYSKIILIDNTRNKLITNLAPNPGKIGSESLLTLSGLDKGKVGITVVNSAGFTIKNIELNSIDGNLQVRLNTMQFIPDIYLLVIRNANGTIAETLKWTVLR